MRPLTGSCQDTWGHAAVEALQVGHLTCLLKNIRICEHEILMGNKNYVPRVGVFRILRQALVCFCNFIMDWNSLFLAQLILWNYTFFIKLQYLTY